VTFSHQTKSDFEENIGDVIETSTVKSVIDRPKIFILENALYSYKKKN